ncbi:MAG: energy-coupled thiamine transporter ThiT [Firmicutes bacterium]|nr:energy-coupled thiamine transporter ThiT [Bacillota bacterium]
MFESEFWYNEGKWIVFAVLILVAALFLIFLYSKNKLTTKSITYGAVLISLAFAFSLLPPIFKMPQGGSIRFLVMLPLFLYAYCFGFFKGVIVCCIYGALDMLLDPFIVHPLQAILDYPLAYAFLGCAGLFSKITKNQILFLLIGVTMGLVGRFFCHVLSGVIFFSEYADVATYGSVFVYSLAYNSFVFVTGAISIGEILILYFTKQLKILTGHLRKANLKASDRDENIIQSNY